MLEAVDSDDEGEPGFLDDILGRAGVAHVGSGHPKQSGGVPLDELGERALVPTAQRVHESLLIGPTSDAHTGNVKADLQPRPNDA